MYKVEYTFGEDKCRDFFDEARGYGFVDLSDIKEETKAKEALLGGGWNLREANYEDYKQSIVSYASAIASMNKRDVVVFKANVPEYATYKVTFETGEVADDISHMNIFAGRRNCIAHDIDIEKGQNYIKEFHVHVTEYIPALTSIPMEEKAIYISFCGKNACVSRITIEECDVPTVFIAGDSTLTDQNALAPYYRYGSCGGWAQMISQYVKGAAVVNYAHSGLTTNCFRDDGHWDILKKHLKAGDVVMLQFGHNDQKRRNLAAFGGYIDNLRWYVSQVRDMGAYPVIVSPISRVPANDEGFPYSLLAHHALACKMAAEECSVPFIDLHDMTFEYWIKCENVADYFNKGDITHTNDYGAMLIAYMVVCDIKVQTIEPLATLIDADLSVRLPHPDDDTKEVPQEKATPSPFDIEPPFVDMVGHPKYDELCDVFKKGLPDPCVMHIHPDEFMPRGQFLMLFFKALGLSGLRPYQGKYCDISKYEWDSGYVQTCVEENLIDPVTVSDDRFYPDAPLTYGEFASLVIRAMSEKEKRDELSLNDCMSQALRQSVLDDCISLKAPISRADCYIGLARVMDIRNPKGTQLAGNHPVS